jgi:UDPglucose--hexose-1-phosphate uridylyltransferase
MPELRFDPLRQEWVAYNTERNDRTFLPTSFCPLCPTGADGDSEIPLDDFEVVVFENRFPALASGCEVVVYTADHHQTLAQLPVERVRLLVDVWSDRYESLGSRPEFEYVFIFENKGEEIGVTLHHPHGQIYALPFIPPVAAMELEASRKHLDTSGRCLHCEQVERELAGERVVLEGRSMIAFVPHAARWPYEVHVYPRRHVASVAELNGGERDDLAAALVEVASAYDRHFGFSTPYVMAMHQAPTDGRHWPEAHLHVEFYPPHRRGDRLKHPAGVELGAGTFVNDTRPEVTAGELRRAVASGTRVGAG